MIDEHTYTHLSLSKTTLPAPPPLSLAYKRAFPFSTSVARRTNPPSKLLAVARRCKVKRAPRLSRGHFNILEFHAFRIDRPLPKTVPLGTRRRVRPGTKFNTWNTRGTPDFRATVNLCARACACVDLHVRARVLLLELFKTCPPFLGLNSHLPLRDTLQPHRSNQPNDLDPRVPALRRGVL